MLCLVGSEPEVTVGRRIVDNGSGAAARYAGGCGACCRLRLRKVPTLPDGLRSGQQWYRDFWRLGRLELLVVMVNFRPKVHHLFPHYPQPHPLPRYRDMGHLKSTILLAGLVTLTSWRSGSILILLSTLVWVPLVFAYQITMLAVGLNPTPLMGGFVMCAAAFSIAAPSSPCTGRRLSRWRHSRHHPARHERDPSRQLCLSVPRHESNHSHPAWDHRPMAHTGNVWHSSHANTPLP